MDEDSILQMLKGNSKNPSENLGEDNNGDPVMNAKAYNGRNISLERRSFSVEINHADDDHSSVFEAILRKAENDSEND